MESRWYLFPGQTLENTKISDRANALHITNSAWQGITRHLDRNKLIQEAIDKEKAVKKYLYEGSKNMTQGWDNSLENVRKRKEEERERLLEQKKQDRMERFLEMRKEQEEIRKQYMQKVKKQIFMDTGHARDLTSALVTSEVLFERERQIEMQNKIKRHEEEEEKKYNEKVKIGAEMEVKEKLEKQTKKKLECIEHEKALKKIIDENEALKRALKEERINQEAIDNIKAVEEMEKLDALKAKERSDKKKELYAEKLKLLQQAEERKKQLIKEDKEFDEVLQIYKEAKHKIDCMKKDRVKEMQEEMVKRRDAVAKLVIAEGADRSAAEEKFMKKAIEEREAAEMEKLNKRAAYDKRMKEERLQNREDFLKRKEKRLQQEDQMRKWEMLNRYKSDEVTRKYEENKKKDRWNRVLLYRKDLEEQLNDHRLEQQREREIEDVFDKMALGDEDEKFFEYANEVLELAKKKGRSTYQIERIISKYAKENNIQQNEIQEQINSCGDSNENSFKQKLVKKPTHKLCRCHTKCRYSK